MMPNFVNGEVKGGTSVSVSDFKLSRLWQEDLPELNESDSGGNQTPGAVTVAGTLKSGWHPLYRTTAAGNQHATGGRRYQL
jgi:hypothetical protein